MDGFFGIVAQGELPVDSAHLARMAAAAPWYGRDDRGEWIQPGHAPRVAIGHLAQWGTPEARHAHQPWVAPNGEVVIAGEIRLDNRAELLAELPSVSERSSPVVGDVELIGAACARWGDAFAAHLVGDFAFVLWDDARGKLLCVRDAIGPIPLYYYATHELFIFANDIRAVVAHPGVQIRLSDEAIAKHLSQISYVLSPDTYFAGVKKVLPGHVLAIDDNGVSDTIFWSPKHVSPVNLPDIDAYIDEFNRRFDRAVKDRLRACGPVAAHVSGGLDSTSVAATAVRLLAERGECLAAGYHWFPEPRTAEEEASSEYVAMRRAEAFLGLALEGVELTPDYLAQQFGRDIALDGAYIDLWYEPLVRQRAQAEGIGLILSGWGGDEVVSSGSGGYFPELVRSAQWTKLWRMARNRARHGTPQPAKPFRLIWREGVRPFVERLGLRKSHVRMGKPNPYIATDFVEQVHKSARLYRRNPVLSVRDFQRARLDTGHLQKRMEVWATQGAQDSIRYAYPLLDRRLVEFVLGIPAEIWVDEHYSRGFFRRSLEGRLPDEIRLYDAKHEPVRVNQFLEIINEAVTLWWASVETDPGTRSQVYRRAKRYVDLPRFVQDVVGTAGAGEAAPRTSVKPIPSLQVVQAVSLAARYGQDSPI